MSNSVQKVIALYKKVSKTNFILINSIQSGILLVSSDFIAQKFVEKKEHVNLSRSLQFLTIGATFVGPFSSVFFKRLHISYATSKQQKRNIVIQKVALDQLIFAPTLVAGMMFLKNALQGESIEEIKLEFQDKYVNIMQMNYSLWPFLKLFKYYFVPLHFQVLYSQGFAFLWNIYMTWKINCKRDVGARLEL